MDERHNKRQKMEFNFNSLKAMEEHPNTECSFPNRSHSEMFCNQFHLKSLESGKKYDEMNPSAIKEEIDDFNVNGIRGPMSEMQNFLQYPVKDESQNKKPSNNIDQPNGLISNTNESNQLTATTANNCEAYLIKEMHSNSSQINNNAILNATVKKEYAGNFAAQSSLIGSACLRKERNDNKQTSSPKTGEVFYVKEMLNCAAPMKTIASSSITLDDVDTFRRVPCLISPKALGEMDCDVSNSNSKHNYVMESFKKHDARRATHNEIERRRRDKINSWIFKLKELIPDENTKSNEETISPHNGNSTRNTLDPMKASIVCCRSTANDSKSQILIKACDYIKTMQDEMKSLRACLKENESLRSSNQQLRNELDQLKNNQNKDLQALI